MKKVLAVFLLAVVALPAIAQHHGRHGHHHSGYYRSGGYGNWIAPVLIGGVIGYGLTRQYYDPVYGNPPTVIYTIPAPVVVQPQSICTVWTETQHSDGTITRTRTCSQ